MKIQTNTAKTINETLSIGQFLRNGGNRVFEITSLDTKSIGLTTLNGEVTKQLFLSREVFVKLFFMGNYAQVTNPANALNEAIESRKVGANRFLIK
jgi:hypothetical protein